MRDARIERLVAAVAARRNDPAFRRAYADLRETVAWAIDPRHDDRDLARLLARYVPGDTPVAARFEAVLCGLPREIREAPGAEYDHPLSRGGERSHALLADGLIFHRPGASALDPWAGEGGLLATYAARTGAPVFGNEADPARYARAVARLGRASGGLCLAESFHLPERRPTPGFDFSDDENTARITAQQSVAFVAILSDLRGRKLEPCVRWMAGRLAPEGVVAFLSDGAFVDEPAQAAFRAWLEREFVLVAHLAPADGPALTFLVRGGRERRILYATEGRAAHAEIEWSELQPTERHVWRTEILRPEWAEFLPLVGERGALFAELSSGMIDGKDIAAPIGKADRRVLRNPFAPAWRTLDRKARREPMPIEGPTIVVLGEPFGVVASAVPVDRRFGGARASVRTVGGKASATALRRMRAAYGAEVAERDAFDAALALLYHPAYPTRYHEDLRRSVPRLPLPSPERLAALAEAEGAPPVGPGAAFGTGWLDAADFEPGALPDYDDPFATPYARSDVAPGFLLLVGLGAALYRLQTDFERLLPYSLTPFGEPGPAMRLSADRTRVVGVLEGIPPEASAWRIGAKSALEWAVEATRVRRDFDPRRAEDPERPLRLIGQVVAAALEVGRLAEILGRVEL